MNKTIRTAAVFAVLSMMAVSCQKEQVIDPSGVEARVGVLRNGNAIDYYL